MHSIRRSVHRLAAAAPLLAAVAVVPASAAVVGDARLEQYCAEEAMARLDVDRSSILTLPTEHSKGRYYVNRQTPDSGQDVTTFECQFDGKKAFKSFKVTGKPHKASTGGAKGAPRAALAKCLEVLGAPAKVVQFSPLKPGYGEIILQETESSRKVACTVPDDGSVIEDWVEMR